MASTLQEQLKLLAQQIGTDIKALRSSVDSIKGDGEGSVSDQISTALGTLSVSEGQDSTVQNAIAKALADANKYTDDSIGTLIGEEGAESVTVADAIAKAKADAGDYTDGQIGELSFNADTQDSAKTVATAIAQGDASTLQSAKDYADEQIEGAIGELPKKADSTEYADLVEYIGAVASGASSGLEDALGELEGEEGDDDVTVADAIAKAKADANENTETRLGTLIGAEGDDDVTVADAIAKADTDAQGYAETAEGNANDYTDGKLGTLIFDAETAEENQTVAEAIRKAVADEADARDSAIETAVSSVYRSKGSKTSVSALPTEGNVVGDVWNINSSDEYNGRNFVYVGEGGDYGDGKWDELGGLFAYKLEEDPVTTYIAYRDGTASETPAPDAEEQP